MSVFSELVVEDAALAWVESLDWAAKSGPDIAPGELPMRAIARGEKLGLTGRGIEFLNATESAQRSTV
jgi:hypothetical protein